MSWSSSDYPANVASPPALDTLRQSPLGPSAVRDGLDAARQALAARTPQADYPDGYLGEYTTRRDRLTAEAGGGDRTQRGVHKGTALPGSDYSWPEEFGPMSGIAAQARGERFVSAAAVEAYQPSLADPGPVPTDQIMPTWITGGPGIPL